MSSQKITLTPPQKSRWQLPTLVLLLGIIWLLVWQQLQALADWLTYDLIGLLPETHLGESV
ncbi:MAG: permease, partial [Ardenticatenaceae bacterium]|nr:permease [Ardenticatenaceae bacterium]